MPIPAIETITLPVLPVPDGVILPETVVTISLQSDESRLVLEAATAAATTTASDDQVSTAEKARILLVPRLGDDVGRFAKVGVTATIEDVGELPDGSAAITVRTHQRARIGHGVIGSSPGLWVEAEPMLDVESASTPDLVAEYRAAASNLLHRVGGRRMAGALQEIDGAGALADTIGHWPELSLERRMTLLETLDVDERLRLGIGWVKEALVDLELREKIQKEVTDDLDKGQREALLRRQMGVIQNELGEGDADIVGNYRKQLLDLDGRLSDAAAEAIGKEIDRLERTGLESMDANWTRSWLDTALELPWGVHANDEPGLSEARSILDDDHTGLDEVKDRLLEYLAVRKLKADRAGELEVDDSHHHRQGVILALNGPPGVGKTSLGQSVARALGRPFVRLALGGIRDEAEIRGHRRTYVGARPGRLVRALSDAGSMNPVILLDEIDKITGGWNGDPSAALLEVLDPAQNHSFQDHYLEFELDLSDVVFIATANEIDAIPAPLLDRMDVIGLDGYTEREKVAIARDHLLPRLMTRNGLRQEEVTVSDEVIERISSDYTREAGVRQLERLLDKVLRKSLTGFASGTETSQVIVEPDDLRQLLGRPVPKEAVLDRIDRPGIATGLAVTGAGGDVLFVETALVPGDGDALLTGQLGDVMKESASVARSVVSGHGSRFGAEWPEGKRLHVHFPAGGIPKDGPSAGITMTTALVSLLTGRLVRPEVGMTGEVTLQGRVLPIGGVKQKVLAAHRAGLREVILPIANGPDLEDVPADVLEALTVHLANDIEDVLRVALAPVDVMAC